MSCPRSVEVREFRLPESAHTCFVEKNAETKHRGRPSKGPRHSFTVKLDPARSAKLKEILRTQGVAGTDYLGPIIEAHVDAVDLRRVGSPPRSERKLAAVGSRNESAPRAVLPWKPNQGEALDRARMLAWKTQLLLDTRVNPSGQRYTFPMIQAAIGSGLLSRTRWQWLKEGKVQVVSDECLRAIAKVFDVPAEYLLHENAPMPPAVAAVLPQLRIRRLSEVRKFAVKALEPVDPGLLQEITTVIYQALQEEPATYGAGEGSFRWVAVSRTDCRADMRRRAFAGELRR